MIKKGGFWSLEFLEEQERLKNAKWKKKKNAYCGYLKLMDLCQTLPIGCPIRSMFSTCLGFKNTCSVSQCNFWLGQLERNAILEIVEDCKCFA